MENVGGFAGVLAWLERRVGAEGRGGSTKGESGAGGLDALEAALPAEEDEAFWGTVRRTPAWVRALCCEALRRGLESVEGDGGERRWERDGEMGVRIAVEALGTIASLLRVDAIVKVGGKVDANCTGKVVLDRKKLGRGFIGDLCDAGDGNDEQDAHEDDDCDYYVSKRSDGSVDGDRKATGV